MTVKKFYEAWDFQTMEDGFSIKLGENQSVLIYEGDDVLIGYLGDLVVKKIVMDKKTVTLIPQTVTSFVREVAVE